MSKIAAEAFARYSERCPNYIAGHLERRPANAFNVEIGETHPRCKACLPQHWPAGSSALRWLGSGGSPLVFGRCTPGGCPLKPDHCEECGHRAEHHFRVNQWRYGCHVEGCACPRC